MKQILVMIAVVVVGCHAENKKNASKAKAIAEFKAAAWVSDPSDPNNIKIEAAIRRAAKKPTGELTKADLEKVTGLNLRVKQLTDVKGLEKLTQLERIVLSGNELNSVKGLEKLTQLTELGLRENQLTDVKGLENLTKLTYLNLGNNPALTKAQIEELQKALPKCEIKSNPTK